MIETKDSNFVVLVTSELPLKMAEIQTRPLSYRPSFQFRTDLCLGCVKF